MSVQAANDIQLDAAIYGNHTEAMVGRAGIPALFAGNAENGIVRNGRSKETLKGFFLRCGDTGQNTSARAKGPNAAGEHSGIDAGQTGDVVFFQQLAQRTRIPEVGGHVVVIADDQPAERWVFAFEIFVGDAVVAD